MRFRLPVIPITLLAFAASLPRSSAAQALLGWGEGQESTQESSAATGAATPSWEGGHPEEASDSAPSPTATSEADYSLDERVDLLDRYLDEIQGPTRTYLYSWMAIQAGLFVGQGTYALRSDSELIRTSYFIGTGVSAISMGLFLLQKWPGARAIKRYRAMPADTEQQKREKIAAGEEWLAAQAAADRRATSWLRHLLGVGAAVGSAGIIVFMHEHSLKEAVRRTFATFVVSELQILTRPRKARRLYDAYTGSGGRGVDLTVAPWVDRFAQGLSLHASF